jgi:hypothetical protein
MQIIKIYILLLPLLWLLSCSAPHDNPLDPASPNYVEPDPPVIVPPDPTFSTSLQSVHKDRTSIDTYRLIAELWPDSNMIIDSVTVQYMNTTARTCRFLSNNGHWSYTFIPNNFGSDDLEVAVGQPFYYHVYTPDGPIWDVGPAYLIRVLHETTTTNSPSGGESVSPFPVMTWEPYNVTFPFTYKVVIEFVTRQVAIDTAWVSESLASNITSVAVTDSLFDSVPNQASDSLYYQWTIVAYDNFGNLVSSIEAVFNVDSGVER